MIEKGAALQDRTTAVGTAAERWALIIVSACCQRVFTHLFKIAKLANYLKLSKIKLENSEKLKNMQYNILLFRAFLI